MWSESCSPTKIEQMIGNEEARLFVAKWLLRWVDGSRPLLIVGPTGVGKTRVVKALAQQFDFDLIEMNASDTRNRDKLMKMILPVLKNKSLFKKRTILFLDEVDGIYAKHETGGLESLLAIVKEPTLPIILAANSVDKGDSKLKMLSKVCKVIKFNKVPSSSLLLILNRLLREKGIEVEQDRKISVVENANGDVRSLLNILQSLQSGYNTVRDVSFEIDISSAIEDFFSSQNVEEAERSLRNANGTYSNLHDPFNNVIGITSAGLVQILELSAWMKPVINSATGSTSLTITTCQRLSR